MTKNELRQTIMKLIYDQTADDNTNINVGDMVEILTSACFAFMMMVVDNKVMTKEQALQLTKAWYDQCVLSFEQTVTELNHPVN